MGGYVSSYIFPLGFIIEVDNANFNPNSWYSHGNWERIKGKVIVGVDENDTDFNESGKIIGIKNNTHYHTLSNKGGAKISFAWSSAWNNYLSLTDGGPSFTGRLRMDNLPTYYGQGAYMQNSASLIGITENSNISIIQPSYTSYIWKLVSYK